MRYFGIDPGMSGGLAWSEFGEVHADPMPETERDIWEWLDVHYPKLIGKSAAAFAVIEQVGGHIAGKNQPGSAMFKFGQSYGALRMALTAADIPYELITPQKWQKGLGVVPRKKEETKTQWKNRLKAHAQRLFPTATITLATADALLIAEYCRRLREGKLNGGES